MHFFLQNLGCPKNAVDGGYIEAVLLEKGLQPVMQPEYADLIVVNTCGFIEDAKRESIDAILQACSRQGNGTRVIAAGCLTQRYREEIEKAVPELDAVFGIGELDALSEYIDGQTPRTGISPGSESASIRTESGSRTVYPQEPYAYLKISDGCDNRCSYCAIPSIRGTARSRRIEDVIGEARQLADLGFPELILVGQDLASYGRDIYGKPVLKHLLAELDSSAAVKWIRVMYLHPDSIDVDLIEAIAECKRVVPYLDIPIQHAGNEILARMNRRKTRRELVDLIRTIRQVMPDAALRTTMMVGFPGETEEHFAELMEFVSQVKFDHLGAFAYSREDGTAAADMPRQVPDETKYRRLDELMTLQREIAFESNRRRIGREYEVIVQECGRGARAVGRAYFQAPEVDTEILIADNNHLRKGEAVNVKITGTEGYELVGVKEGRTYSMER